MSDNRALFIEESILGAVKRLLSGRVNELLGEMEDAVPLVEFGGYRGGGAVVPVVGLSACERSEKERIVCVDAYALTIAFAVPELPSDQGSVGERNCYAYAAAVATALGEDPTLDGVVDRAELTGKKYMPPTSPGTGGEWKLTLTVRVTVEGGYAG